MLLNQLGVHRGCEIVFDTSSVMAMVRPEDSEPQSGTLVACVCASNGVGALFQKHDVFRCIYT
jgi:hypothetical protein